MRHYKLTENGFITAIGKGAGGVEITEEQYAEIIAVIKDRPTAPAGFEYVLTEGLQWELFEMPVDEDHEISDAEALKIILGGAT